MSAYSCLKGTKVKRWLNEFILHFKQWWVKLFIIVSIFVVTTENS